MGVLETAESFIGKVTYRFGSTAVEQGKADCSAFTQYVFKQNGYNIGRTTSEQVKKGTKVSKAEARPGDLIFFQGTYRAGVSHVGIVVGNGEMIDCGEANGVSRRSYNTDYWNQHFLEVRRVDGVDIGTGSGAVNDSEDSEEETKLDLTWWGDIVSVVIVVLLILAALLFVLKAINVK